MRGKRYSDLSAEELERERKSSREYQRRRRAAMTDAEKKAESKRVWAIQRHYGPRRWVYKPTPKLLAQARERVRRWRQANPEYDRNRQHRRRAATEANVDREWLRVLAQDPCAYCGGPGGTVDHIEPLAAGGPHEVQNLTGACRRCNSRKAKHQLLSALE